MRWIGGRAIALLLAAALALQCLWYVTLAVLLWAPPATVGVVTGWLIYAVSHHLIASLAAAVLAHRLIRIGMKRVLEGLIVRAGQRSGV